MQSENNRDYYHRREAAEREAAEKAIGVVKRIHLELADRYAARSMGAMAGDGEGVAA